MKVIYVLMSVVSLLLLFFFLIIGRCEFIQSPQMDAIVDVITIFIGIMSMVSGLVSIKVMLSQEKTQVELLDAQKREHQPNFLINYKVSQSNPALNDYDVEEFTIENIGEQILSPAKITVRSFIKVQYIDVHSGVNKTAYYPLAYYYGRTSSTSQLKDMLLFSRDSDLFQNRGKYFNLYTSAIAYHKVPGHGMILLDKVDLFNISYVDIYDEKKTSYYLGTYRTNAETYDEIMNSAPIDITKKSIVDVTFQDLVDFINAV